MFCGRMSEKKVRLWLRRKIVELTCSETMAHSLQGHRLTPYQSAIDL